MLLTNMYRRVNKLDIVSNNMTSMDDNNDDVVIIAAADSTGIKVTNTEDRVDARKMACK